MNNSSVDALASSSRANETALLARYNTYFRTQTANTSELIKTALAIRYQVYCLERKFEDPAQHVSRLERDGFDRNAIHNLLFHRPTEEAIGTVRLILPGTEAHSLPIQQLLCENGPYTGNYFPPQTTAEVSRFAISNEFRRRSTDNTTSPLVGDNQRRRENERGRNLPCLGLIQILLRQSIHCGITHWAAVMEPKLLRMLAGMGIHFTPIGPVVSHHGLRQPSYCHLPRMLETLQRERPKYWNVVTDAGDLAEESPVQRRAA